MKASIQLSVNFLVVIILCMMIMSFGFVLVQKMSIETNKMMTTVSAELERKILNLLTLEGKPVMIPIVQREIERGDWYVFGIGVLNLMNNAPSNTFYVDIRLSTFIPSEDVENTGVLANSYVEVILFKKSFDLKNNDKTVYSVPIKVNKNAKSGTYVFNVYVGEGASCENNVVACYDGLVHKLYVKVS